MVEHMKRGKEGSSSACAISQWCYDMFGPECHANTKQDMKLEGIFVAVSDIRSDVRYRFEVTGTFGGFNPLSYDQGHARPGSFMIVGPAAVQNLAEIRRAPRPKRPGVARKTRGVSKPRQWL